MKSNSFKSRLPIIAILALILLIGIGIIRSCNNHAGSRLIQSFRPPTDNTLFVAIEMSPLTYAFSNDTAEGFDYEIIKSIALEHNIPVVFHPVVNLEEAFNGLYDGKYNLVVGNMPATSGLREIFPLTNDVYRGRQVLLQRRLDDSTLAVNSQLDLRGDTVYLAPGSPVQSRLRNLASELGDRITVETLPGHNSEHLAIMTANGDIKYAIVSEAVARRVASDYPLLDFSTPISFNQFQVWAVAPADTLLRDSLNVWIDEFKQSPQYTRLAQKYL